MNIYSLDETINITSSILYHLENTYIYRNNINSGTLNTYYPDIKFKIGFPSNMVELTLPTIALQGPEPLANEVITNGEWDEKTFSYRAHVFAGGQRTNNVIDEGKNAYQKLRLANDVKALLDSNRDSSYINYYNFSDIISSGTKYRTDEDVMIQNVSGSSLDPTGETEADRYRAVIDFNASVIYSQNG